MAALGRTVGRAANAAPIAALAIAIHFAERPGLPNAYQRHLSATDTPR